MEEGRGSVLRAARSIMCLFFTGEASETQNSVDTSRTRARVVGGGGEGGEAVDSAHRVLHNWMHSWEQSLVTWFCNWIRVFLWRPPNFVTV